MTSCRKLIIDCDTGVDDAQAIILALADSSTEVLAITCVAGNVDVCTCARNTMRVLHSAGRSTDVPVYMGASKPLLSIPCMETVHSDATKYHGNDGLGDAPHATTGKPAYDLINTDKFAPLLMAELSRKHPGEITLVALGPLTNVALALKIDEQFSSNLKDIYLMGGAVYAKGNVTVTGEFNVVQDPEAAMIVLEESVCPVNVMPWETTSKHGLDWFWHANWLKQPSEVMTFLSEITRHTCEQDRVTWNVLFSPPDLVTMAWALRSHLATDVKEKCYCTVDTSHSPFTRGMFIVDWKDLLKKAKKNINVCLSWDVEVFQQTLEMI